MWFIGFLSLLLIPIFVLFAIVALIRKKAAKKYFIAAGFSVLVFGFAIIQSSKDKNTTSPATVTQTQQEKAKSIEEANKLETENKSNSANIGMTPEQFQKKFNESAASLGQNFRIKNIKVENGKKENGFFVDFTKNLVLASSINKKDNYITKIRLISRVNDIDSASDVVLGIYTLMATLNPELSSDERIEVIKELGLADKTKVDNGKKSTIRNGILYTLLVSEKVGVIFNAESTNKKTQ